MSGELYMVATPIGNLEDITLRAVSILKSVDIVLCEDTRVTLKLLRHLQIEKRLISYHENSSEAKDDKIIQELQEGVTYALVSDAGTPAVSDPGGRLVAKARAAGISVIPIPGASAVSSLVSVFGVRESVYHFWGFFPQKKKKKTELLENINNLKGLHVFFESPYRVEKTLSEWFLGHDDLLVMVGREMTKQHETFHVGTPSEVLASLGSDTIKGEFCVGIMKQG